MLALPQRLVLLAQVPEGTHATTARRCAPALLAARARSRSSAAPAQSYWPFHRAWCRSNEFADAVEATEPRFARWMRKHHKIAVLKDDEVDRLERKARGLRAPARGRSFGRLLRGAEACCRCVAPCRVPSRQVATVDDMYGRANPKPLAPSYDADDMRAMRAAEERCALEARASATGALRRCFAARAALTRGRAERLWTSLVVPELMGLDLDRYKWRQDQARRRAACTPPAMA